LSPQLVERVKVLLREPHSVSTLRPPNVACHAAPQELTAIVYLGERPLAFMAITGGAFVGHSKWSFRGSHSPRLPTERLSAGGGCKAGAMAMIVAVTDSNRKSRNDMGRTLPQGTEDKKRKPKSPQASPRFSRLQPHQGSASAVLRQRLWRRHPRLRWWKPARPPRPELQQSIQQGQTTPLAIAARDLVSSPLTAQITRKSLKDSRKRGRPTPARSKCGRKGRRQSFSY
jgi:hypothetical protein